MTTNRNSQLRLLAAHLASGKTISPAEARAVYGIDRLAARVRDLRERFLPIATTARVDARGKRYARYKVAGGCAFIALDGAYGAIPRRGNPLMRFRRIMRAAGL
jgi:hypothetical protein